jgi:cell wall-associated NlpC family hydrolase
MNQLIGIPYKELDCFALVRMASEKLFNTVLPDIHDYLLNPAEAIDIQKKFANWKELENPEPGCVVVLGQTPTYAKHVGLFLGPGVLHTCHKYGSIVQDEYQLLATGYTNFQFYKWIG